MWSFRISSPKLSMLACMASASVTIFLLCFSLDAHKSGEHFQIINKHLIIGKHYKVAVFVHAIERMGGSVPRVENRAGRHVLIPVRCLVAAVWEYKTNVVMAGHWCAVTGKCCSGVLVAPIFVVDFTRLQKSGNLQPEDVDTVRMGRRRQWSSSHVLLSTPTLASLMRLRII